MSCGEPDAIGVQQQQQAACHMPHVVDLFVPAHDQATTTSKTMGDKRHAEKCKLRWAAEAEAGGNAGGAYAYLANTWAKSNGNEASRLEARAKKRPGAEHILNYLC